MFRLLAAIWVLVRADALLPREADPLLPPGLQALARVLRLFSGRAARAGRPGERLARALERMGPVAIKLGQFLSTRGDIFGETFARDLARLQDRLPAFPTAVAKTDIERALDKPLGEVFATFSEPVAAASLAQAHRATLMDGREVAVKVLRPGIERRVARDVKTLALAGRIAARWPVARRLEPEAFVATIARTLVLELDLRMEAAAADELGKVLADAGYMRAPRVIWDGVAKRVLTLEWVAGAPLSQDGVLEGLDRPRLADNLTRGFLAQALDHGVFHADLHEGNLFVAPPADLAVVDFGIVGRLGPAERRFLAEVLWGFLQRDYQHLAETHFRAGYVPAHHDRGAFAQALRAVGEPVFGRPVKDVSMGRLLGQLFDITSLFDMRLRPELVLLQKTMVVVEGVARRIDPEHDIWAAADPVVRAWMARELSPLATAGQLIGEARAAIGVLAAAAVTASEPRRPYQAPPEPAERFDPWLAFALGAVTAAAAFALALWLR